MRRVRCPEYHEERGRLFCHRISEEKCRLRQESFYHRCHHCHHARQHSFETPRLVS